MSDSELAHLRSLHEELTNRHAELLAAAKYVIHCPAAVFGYERAIEALKDAITKAEEPMP